MIMSAPNHLINETSPYLLQHAHNPVEWYPWNDEALAKARTEEKPILLSIGYSACHWCHVMAHESFEDETCAEIMNRLFVNIKVDREERPDLDKIYQFSHQLLTQRSGGWPLTMFLTPQDLIPFFGGTYFPKHTRYGLPAFSDLLVQIHTFFRDHRQDIEQQNERLKDVFDQLANTNSAADRQAINVTPLDVARNQLGQSYDADHGGFGSAPKFPHPPNIERLMRHWLETSRLGHPDHEALDMALTTLEKMAEGGIYDQLGGGFSRYSVDQYWMIPHFEKMLYDNALLLPLYIDAGRISQIPLYKRVAAETARWVIREMQSADGGYYSTLDADSEGHEGQFYVWQKSEVEALLSKQEYQIVAAHFGLDRDPNFESKSWHLHTFQSLSEISQRLKITHEEANILLNNAKQKLLAVRNLRIWPGRDEKILTSWNGLMIKGMAIAGRHLNEPMFIESAERALHFVYSTLWKNDRLLATYKDGKAHLNAYLDDYVFLIDAILEILQCRWRDEDLHWARKLGDAVLNFFEDKQNGGFFFTSDDHPQLIQRPKPFGDDALPAGNGIAAYIFGRLGHITGDTRYLDAQERTLKAGWSAIEELPYAHNTMLLALEEYLQPPEIIYIRANQDLLPVWQSAANRNYAPKRLVFGITSGGQGLPGENQSPATDAVAYRCSGVSCSAPIERLDVLEEVLQEGQSSYMV